MITRKFELSALGVVAGNLCIGKALEFCGP